MGDRADDAATSQVEIAPEIYERVNALCRALPDATDWDEIRELVTDSYRRLASKKLSALLD